MIRASTRDPAFSQAWSNAHRALPVEQLESPRQYGSRWRKAYRCRVEVDNSEWPHTCYIFDCDKDYTWFMLKWQ